MRVDKGKGLRQRPLGDSVYASTSYHADEGILLSYGFPLTFDLNARIYV